MLVLGLWPLMADRAVDLSVKALVTDGPSTGYELTRRGKEQLTSVVTLLKASRVSSPPSSTDILQHGLSSPAAGHTRDAEGPRPLLPPSTTFSYSQPACLAGHSGNA